jgi:hypothetical protein
LSFLKHSWELSDYPIRVREQQVGNYGVDVSDIESGKSSEISDRIAASELAIE